MIGVDLADATGRRAPPHGSDEGTGRELFRLFRNAVGAADSGATIFATMNTRSGPRRGLNQR